MLSVAPPVKTAQAHQLPKAERNVIVKEQNPVFRARKRSGDPQKETAVHSVQTLRQPAVEAGQYSIMLWFLMMEGKRQTQVLPGNPLRRISCPTQPLIKGLQHFSVAKSDCHFQTQFAGARKNTRQESRQPPMSFRNLHAGTLPRT